MLLDIIFVLGARAVLVSLKCLGLLIQNIAIRLL